MFPMKIDNDRKKKEALHRMMMLDLFDVAIMQFAENEAINISEPPLGILYWPEEKECEEIKQWEQEHNAMVYHVIRSFTNIGTLDAYLYVSDYEEDWARERELLKRGRSNAYVVNRKTPEFSEFGPIAFRLTIGGGLERTA